MLNAKCIQAGFVPGHCRIPESPDCHAQGEVFLGLLGKVSGTLQADSVKQPRLAGQGFPSHSAGVPLIAALPHYK